ncbi:hypothetical protein PSAB6_160079 [Paraburkholderia sabiae]|nr:hypothetical protein PSAB6_160079 [Paraburkholderia sabiae]
MWHVRFAFGLGVGVGFFCFRWTWFLAFRFCLQIKPLTPLVLVVIHGPPTSPHFSR